MRNSVVVAIGAFFAFPSAVVAQEAAPVIQPTAELSQPPAAECLCVLPAEAGPGIAAVQDVQGQVLLSHAVGYIPIQSNAELSVGDRVVLLKDGHAVLTGPACQVALAPDSMISLIPTDAGVCVAHASTAHDRVTVIQPAADLPPPILEAPQPIPTQPIPNVVPALVGSALFAGGMAAIILLSDDAPRPVSP